MARRSRSKLGPLVAPLALSVVLLWSGMLTSSHDGDGGRGGFAQLHRFLSSSYSEEEIEEEMDSKDLSVIVCTILCLIIVTLAFEHFKHHVESHCSEETELVLEKLFGELTVLGFLAMTIFLIDQSGLLEAIAKGIDFDEFELAEYVEDVHYALFSVMVFFVVQVMFLVKFAAETSNHWIKMDKECRDELIASNNGEWAPTEEERHAISDLRKESWITRFIPQLFDKEAEKIRDTVIFRALRHEFILDRSDEPPFQPQASEKRLDFDFGRYLSIAQSRGLAHIVEVEQEAWVCNAAGTIAFYMFALMVQESMQILAWTWVAIGWCVYLFNVVFEQHLINLRRNFFPRKVDILLYGPTPTTNSQDEREWDFALLEENGVDSLPGWCNVDPEFYAEQQRSWITKKLVGGKATRQQSLFWMDRHGPQFYLLILQLNMLFTGIYVGLLVLAFIPAILEESNLAKTVSFCLLAFIPAICIMYNKKRLVATLAQVCSIGSYRKLQIVNDVKRQQKTFDVVRTLIVIYHMHCLNVQNDSKPIRLLEESERSKLSNSERARVNKMFDIFDADGNGDISLDELKDLLAHLGISNSPETLGRIGAILDDDGDGSISRDEFVQWYASIVGEEISTDDLARQMFSNFDIYNHGEITLGEFKQRIDAVSMGGLTLDEIGAMVHELDRDRNGTISFVEFKAFLVRYMPEEMQNER